MEIDPLPCPFCGADARRTIEGRNHFIDCTNMKCDCTNMKCPAMPMAIGKDFPEAAQRWNQRAADDNEADAGTMRMLREKAQAMGYEDTLQALEHLEEMKGEGMDVLIRLIGETEPKPYKALRVET